MKKIIFACFLLFMGNAFGMQQPGQVISQYPELQAIRKQLTDPSAPPPEDPVVLTEETQTTKLFELLLLPILISQKAEQAFALINEIEIKSAVNNKEETALHLAAKNGHNNLIAALLEKDVNINAKNNLNQTPLHYAAKTGQTQAITTLISKKADFNALDLHGNTPLHFAADNGNAEGIILLVNKTKDINAADEYGNTPLHIATYKGHIQAVNTLIANHADVNTKNKIDGNTPLHLAVYNNHVKIATALLSNNAFINAVDIFGNTPLHLAAYKGHIKAAIILLEKGADVNTKNNVNGNTPLHIAASNKHADVAKMLLEKGANVEAINNANQTALILAAEESETKKIIQATQYLFSHLDFLNQVAKDKDYSAQQIAEIAGDIESGAVVNATNKDGITPLRVVTLCGQHEVAMMLVNNGAKISFQDIQAIDGLRNKFWLFKNKYSPQKALLRFKKWLNG